MATFSTGIFAMLVQSSAYASSEQTVAIAQVPIYQFLSSSDFIASRSDREGRTFCKSLLGLPKEQVDERFFYRTDANPLGWVHSEDSTLFSCGDGNLNSQIELRYKAGIVTRVRETRSSILFVPEAKNGRLVGKWVK